MLFYAINKRQLCEESLWVCAYMREKCIQYEAIASLKWISFIFAQHHYIVSGLCSFILSDFVPFSVFLAPSLLLALLLSPSFFVLSLDLIRKLSS